MLRVGLTGGIGSGKSTVVRFFREEGLTALEADELAHELSRRGQPAYQGIVAAFGPEILHPDGEIDRARLATIVFASPEQLARLNQIVHPLVIERANRWLEERERAGAPVAVLEAPLLIETGYHRTLDRLVIVWCRPEQQLERLVARAMNSEDAQRRIAAQIPLAEKLRFADDIIDNSGATDETRKQVAALVERLLSSAGGKKVSSEEQRS